MEADVELILTFDLEAGTVRSRTKALALVR